MFSLTLLYNVIYVVLSVSYSYQYNHSHEENLILQHVISMNVLHLRWMVIYQSNRITKYILGMLFMWILFVNLVLGLSYSCIHNYNNVNKMMIYANIILVVDLVLGLSYSCVQNYNNVNKMIFWNIFMCMCWDTYLCEIIKNRNKYGRKIAK